MSAVATPILGSAAANGSRASRERQNAAPIVAAVGSSAASRAAIAEAVRLGAELDAPIVFVYVRRGPAGFFGSPVYQRRLTREMARARRVLDRALAVAASAGVSAEGEILEGSPRRRVREFARDRGSRLVVRGSGQHNPGRSVVEAVVRGLIEERAPARALHDDLVGSGRSR